MFAKLAFLELWIVQWVILVCVCLAIVVYVVFRGVYLLAKDEQLRISRFTDVDVQHGPKMVVLNPFGYRSALVEKVEILGVMDYARVIDAVDGLERIRKGPQLLFLGPYEQVVSKEQVMSLSSTEYVLVEEKLSGERQVVKGPCVWFPEPQQMGTKKSAISLKSTEFVTVEDLRTGELSIVKGPCVWFPGPYERDHKKKLATSLQDDEYMILKDLQTGERWMQKGKGLVFLQPTWLCEGDVRKATVLKANEYIRILNKQEGKVTTVRGEKTVFLGPEEQFVDENKLIATPLQDNEYIILKDTVSGERWVERGKALLFFEPTWKAETKVEKALVLKANEYVRVLDESTGKVRVVRGETTLFPGAKDRFLEEKCTAVPLENDEYIMLKDVHSGQRWVQKGEALVFLEPTWQKEGHIQKAMTLKANEYIRVLNTGTGKVNMIRGEKTVFPAPLDQLLDDHKQTALPLQEDEYIILKDTNSGERWTQKGKALVFMEATWQIEGKVCKAMVLKTNEYVRVLNKNTGKITVLRGETTVVPGPDDHILDNGKKQAVQIDENHAVLVRNEASGQLHLVTEKQIFVPESNEKIEEVRELINLADHEAMIIKDKDGVYQYHYGSDARRSADQSRSFFLPPYCEIVKMWWSRGPRRERKDQFFERLDIRPHFMKFEFNCRTADNVELILEGVFFWELLDLPLMISMTGDTSGDLCQHVRSQFIQNVARVTLKVFMQDLHEISKQILEADTEFYSARGIKIHSLEITRYQCADKTTSAILEQIIQETTNRLNRLSQAESENEVSIFRMQGQTEQARLNTSFLKIKHEHTEEEALVAGKAEADKITSFMKGLEEKVPLMEDRLKMWQTLRKTEALTAVAQSGAHLYYTPNDVDLTIEARNTPHNT